MGGLGFQESLSRRKHIRYDSIMVSWSYGIMVLWYSESFAVYVDEYVFGLRGLFRRT